MKWKLWQWNKTSLLVSPDLWCDTNRLLLCVFSVWRPVSPNLGYITPVDCPKLTSLCFWNCIQIQTALVNPKFGDVWDKNIRLWKYSFPPKWQGSEWLSSFHKKKALLCQCPYRKARISKGGSKQMHYSWSIRRSSFCRSAAFWRWCCWGTLVGSQRCEGTQIYSLEPPVVVGVSWFACDWKATFRAPAEPSGSLSFKRETRR